MESSPPQSSLVSLVDVAFSANALPYRPYLAGGKPRDRHWTVQIMDLRWSANGGRLACCFGHVVVLSRKPGQLEFTVPTGWSGPPNTLPEPYATSVDFSHDGTLVSGWSDGAVVRGASRDSEELAMIGRVRRIRASPTRELFAATAQTDAKTPSLRNLQVFGRGVPPKQIAEGLPDAAGLAWSPRGDELAYRAHGAVIDVDSDGVELRRWTFDQGSSGSEFGAQIVWSEAGLFTQTPDAVLRLYDGGRVVTLPRPGERFDRPNSASALSVTPDGRFAAAAYYDFTERRDGFEGSLEFFDLTTGEAHALSFDPGMTTHGALAFAPTGDLLAYASKMDLSLHAWGKVDTRETHADLFERVRRTAAGRDIDGALRILKAATIELQHLEEAARLRTELEAQRSQAQKTAPASAAPAKRASGDFEEEDPVVHPQFGEGVVVRVDKHGDAAKLTVDFEGGRRVVRASAVTRG